MSVAFIPEVLENFEELMVILYEYVYTSLHPHISTGMGKT